LFDFVLDGDCCLRASTATAASSHVATLRTYELRQGGFRFSSSSCAFYARVDASALPARLPSSTFLCSLDYISVPSSLVLLVDFDRPAPPPQYPTLKKLLKEDCGR